MDIKDAIKLIEGALPEKMRHARWADLGCGNGTFTIALSHLLGDESKIYAVDRQSQDIHLPAHVEIEFIKADFSKGALPFSNLDGILMANSLHYIKDKNVLVKKLNNYLKADGQVIVVEYDTAVANQWVPYPVPFDRIKDLFYANGLDTVEKIGEYNSVYNSNKMYACVLRRV